MDPSKSLDHFADRRDLLRGFLEEYIILAHEHPEVAEQLSFEGFVQFSFAYFRIGEQTGGVERLATQVASMRARLPS